MTGRAIISVSRLCSRLQRLATTTIIKHGQSVSMSTHVTGSQPPSGSGFLPGMFPDTNHMTASDFGTGKDIGLKDLRTRIALDSASLGLDLEYKCPSLHKQKVAILDIAEKTTTSYDCPNLISIIDKEIILPNSSLLNQVEMPTAKKNDTEKHAKNILKIRKRMRKKHQLRKWRKKRESEIRKEKAYKMKKREAKRDKVIEGLVNKGTVFNADTFMEEIMRKAQRGGYRTSLFGENRDV
ncbi:uncharacterized protein LOC132553257 [Ylistrum balloti]|uniref:uncharacterized protein LOC132553257 n=1 Tax=Ylistrum balloti TaxID=509963 RepID=UPI002905A31F|nr:uncharacterized protein LOC132553257 [Ylistrum balloti]